MGQIIGTNPTLGIFDVLGRHKHFDLGTPFRVFGYAPYRVPQVYTGLSQYRVLGVFFLYSFIMGSMGCIYLFWGFWGVPCLEDTLAR
jgi:hypothetical protein